MDEILTDEEIVKALECCGDNDMVCHKCPLIGSDKCHCLELFALDLIHRLQDERDKLFNHSVDLQEQINTLRLEKVKQKAEIERLTKERNKYIIELEDVESANDYANKFLDEYKAKNAELQKQVDELKELNSKYLDSIESVQAGRCRLRCELTKQAVKAEVPLAIQRFINQLDIDGIVKYGSDLYEKLKETKKFVLKRYYGVEVK